MSLTIRILITGGYRIMRRSVQSLLETRDGLQVIGEAADINEIIEKFHALQPDIILVLINYSGFGKGVKIISRIKNEIPSARILALTNSINDSGVYSILKAGVLGYVLKDQSPEDLFNAIVNVSRGAPAINDTIVQKLLENLNKPKGTSELGKLSQRETEILRLLAGGHSNRLIAEKLFISERTVRTHVSNILNKLHLKSRTQAALHALRNGMAEL